MKNVMIKIKATQGTGENAEVIEFTTEGTLQKNGDVITLTYEDNAVVAGARIKTVLIARKKTAVTLERSGAISSKLIIENGVRTTCFYSIPEGSLTLGIYGKEVDAAWNGESGTIKMVYAVDSDMRPISENAVEISISERQGN